MIYIASPYSHESAFVREERYIRTMKVLVELYLMKARWAYSPVVHCHELAKIYNLSRDVSFWRQYNEHMLSKSVELHVLRLDGWATSMGVNEETRFAENRGIPVIYI